MHKMKNIVKMSKTAKYNQNIILYSSVHPAIRHMNRPTDLTFLSRNIIKILYIIKNNAFTVKQLYYFTQNLN